MAGSLPPVSQDPNGTPICLDRDSITDLRLTSTSALLPRLGEFSPWRARNALPRVPCNQVYSRDLGRAKAWEAARAAGAVLGRVASGCPGSSGTSGNGEGKLHCAVLSRALLRSLWTGSAL